MCRSEWNLEVTNTIRMNRARDNFHDETSIFE